MLSVSLKYLTKSKSTFIREISTTSPKLVVKHQVKGYDKFMNLIKHLEKSGERIHVLYSGGKESGSSWCPHCKVAEPIIQNALKIAPEKSHFVYVDIGGRASWKDLQSPFRQDPEIKLLFLPTLLRWKSPQRLEGVKCQKAELVEMLLADDE